jgi:hypothetical protein
VHLGAHRVVEIQDDAELRAELKRMSLGELRHFGRLCVELEKRTPGDTTNLRRLELARKEFVSCQNDNKLRRVRGGEPHVFINNPCARPCGPLQLSSE